MKLRQVDHEARQQILTGGLSRLPQAPGKPEGDGGGVFIDFHRGAQPHHVVDGGVHQAHGAGDGGADDILARLAVAAVIAAYSSSDAKPPISVDDVLFEATPQDVSALVEAVIELRKEWYQVPAVVKPEGEENKDEKNA